MPSRRFGGDGFNTTWSMVIVLQAVGVFAIAKILSGASIRGRAMVRRMAENGGMRSSRAHDFRHRYGLPFPQPPGVQLGLEFQDQFPERKHGCGGVI